MSCGLGALEPQVAADAPLNARAAAQPVMICSETVTGGGIREIVVVVVVLLDLQKSGVA